MGKFIDMKGRVIGRLTVLSKSSKKANTKSQPAYWLCRCQCGKEVTVEGGSLRRAKPTKSCGCIRADLMRKLGKQGLAAKSPGIANLNGLYSSYKKGAKRRKLEFLLDKDKFLELIKDNCHYCGQEPLQDYQTTTSRHQFLYNGLDRKNNSEGYIETNVVTCCKVCNFMKNTLDYNDFLYRIKKIKDKHFIKDCRILTDKIN